MPSSTNKHQYYYALGRRKSSNARVRLQKGKGDIIINGRPATKYLSESKYLLNKIEHPFSVIEQNNQYDISVVVRGGGVNGQIEAIQLGIAKALAEMNEDLKGTLRRAELLGRDPREKERKKFGLKGARKQRQYTKR